MLARRLHYEGEYMRVIVREAFDVRKSGRSCVKTTHACAYSPFPVKEKEVVCNMGTHY